MFVCVCERGWVGWLDGLMGGGGSWRSGENNHL